MIEDESGALESSWQSLLSVQEVVTLLGTFTVHIFPYISHIGIKN